MHLLVNANLHATRFARRRLKAAEASEYDAGRKGGGDVATLRAQWTHLNDDVERVKVRRIF